ncbi:tRNA A-37 threonylcarbamoyl transferase component Bud32 [Rubritalea squalenifaciens DSM 18772]|uniref:tRNA A-37 threonylcarbamoyl transferase component Bud32 n=2 Tax=Rubritalea squalenifaciens TaxID=407226 RepID=A0A1M6EJ76_9BACT|nr:tRNA A-37 threonylcarbamoyl transferase component Bud32 [Rubritalea squalenifaciens DSM 18772]
MTSLEKTWIAPGESLKQGSRSTVTRIDLEGISYVAKIYKKMPFHRRLRYALTRSRAFQSWETGHAMLEAGIPIARPLAIVEERPMGIPARAALLMENAVGEDLLSLVQRQALDSDQLKEIAAKLQVVFFTMEKKRITHGDFKATNIILDDTLSPTFIDNDAAILHQSQKSYQPAAEKDRKRFMANWQTHPEAQEAFRDVFGKTP